MACCLELELFSAALLFIGLSLPSPAQEILCAPMNKTVYLDQTVMFKCKTSSSFSSWLINGTLPEHLPSGTISNLDPISMSTDEGNRFLTLTFPARARYNGTRVQCITRPLGGSLAKSENATLMIQGQLSAVTGLSVASNASSVTISWSAPFSLDVTGVDPDIWYSVIIYNVTDENNPTAILCTDCINITETHYTFTPDYLSPCDVYNFSVIPLNGIGQGENSYLTSSLHEYTVSDHEVNITVFKKPGNVFQLLFTVPLFMINNTVLCFQKHLKLYYNSSTQEQCPSVVSVVSPELTPGDIWLIQSEVVLERDCNYTVNVASPRDSSRIFSINTRVVRVEVGELEGEVVVRCVFRDTLSQRCYVQLVSSEVEGGFQEGGCVEGEGEGVHRFPGLLPVTYTVLVYGLVAGGEEDSCSPAPGDPDYITVATVHGLHPSSANNQPSPTDKMTRAHVIPNPWCAEGISVGVCMGAITTCILFVMGIIVVKVLKKHRERMKVAKSSAASSQRVTMEKNMAYELHKPQHRRKDHTSPQQYCQTPNPIYEDLK